MKIIFATNNKNKLEEAQDILGDEYKLLTPKEYGITEDIPEDEPTLEGNALQKAQYIHKKTGLNCFADDTGLEVRALDNAPGVRSARYAGEEHNFAANTALLLRNLQGKKDRVARFRTAIALIYDNQEYLFEGEVQGEIIDQEIGDKGFGYDPVFVPKGYDMTFAQMDAKEKNSISHRANALVKLAEFLDSKE